MAEKLPQADLMHETARNIITDKLTEVRNSELMEGVRSRIQSAANRGRFDVSLPFAALPELKKSSTREAVLQLLTNGGYSAETRVGYIFVDWS